MSKFGLFSKGDGDEQLERDAMELLIGEQKSAAEVSRIFKEKGHDISPEKVNKFKKNIFESLQDEDKQERYADHMLNSIERITNEFDDLAEMSRKLLIRLEDDGKDSELIKGMREHRELLKVGLRKLGFLETQVNQIKAENINVINTNELVLTMKQEQEKWFEVMDAELIDGKFVFNSPKPELIDDFTKWKARVKMGLPQ